MRVTMTLAEKAKRVGVIEAQVRKLVAAGATMETSEACESLRQDLGEADGGVAFDVKPFDIVTLKLQRGRGCR